jgi:hypothetical protein
MWLLFTLLTVGQVDAGAGPAIEVHLGATKATAALQTPERGVAHRIGDAVAGCLAEREGPADWKKRSLLIELAAAFSAAGASRFKVRSLARS